MFDIAVFPDTNIFLHFRSLTDIDWEEVFPGRTVRLFVCLQVIKELDSKKGDPRLSDKAKKAIKLSRNAVESPYPLRGKATLQVFSEESRPEELSGGSPDQVIIAEVLAYKRAANSKSVFVLTDDLGMQILCKAKQIEVQGLPEEWRLPPAQDEKAKENQKTKAELESLKTRRPSLLLRAIPQGADPAETENAVFLMPRPCPLLDEVEEKRILRERYPFWDDRWHWTFRGRNLLHSLLPIPRGEIQRYNWELRHFHGDHELYVQLVNECREKRLVTFFFDLWCENVGKSPATEIHARLVFPRTIDWVDFLDGSKASELITPSAPLPPDPPTFRLGSRAGIRTRNRPPERMPPDEEDPSHQMDVRGLKERADEMSLDHRFRILKHQDRFKLGTYVVGYRTPEEIKSFQATYTLSCSELPDAVEGKIPFIVRRDGPSQDEQ